MNLFKLSTVGLALVLTGWTACSDSSNSNPDVGHIGSGGAGGTVSSGRATGAGGVVGSGGVADTGGVMASGGVTGAGGITGAGGVTGAGGSTAMGGASGTVADAGVDAPIPSPDVPSDVPADADASSDGSSDGEANSLPPTDICTGLTADKCHLAIIGATADPIVSALDPGANPPVLYPTCSAQ